MKILPKIKCIISNISKKTKELFISAKPNKLNSIKDLPFKEDDLVVSIINPSVIYMVLRVNDFVLDVVKYHDEELGEVHLGVPIEVFKSKKDGASL